MKFFLPMTDSTVSQNIDLSSWISLCVITVQQNKIRYKEWRDLYTRFCSILDDYFYNTLPFSSDFVAIVPFNTVAFHRICINLFYYMA